MWWKYVVVCIIGYFLGCINTATIVAKANKKDIRKMGSGNPGTMNVVRNLGAKWGAVTLVCDLAKSAIPSVLGLLLIPESPGGVCGLYAGGLSAVVGHIYPVINGFKGGKGVACAMGVFFVAAPLWSLVTFAVLLVFLLTVKYGSLGNLLFITVLTVEEGIKFSGILPVSLMLFAIWVLVWFAHRENIVRIIIGTERKSDLTKAFRKIKPDSKK